VVGSGRLKPEWIRHSESIMYGAGVAYIWHCICPKPQKFTALRMNLNICKLKKYLAG